MGAYQHFEFQAIDRPLSAEELQILRGYSSRARITSTGFVNEYSFGDFKGNADEWMRKHLDAFLHVAEWGTRILMMRLPTGLLAKAAFRPYCKAIGWAPPEAPHSKPPAWNGGTPGSGVVAKRCRNSTLQVASPASRFRRMGGFLQQPNSLAG